MRTPRLLVLAAVVLKLGIPSATAVAKTEACPTPARFLVLGAPLLPGNPSPEPEAIVIEGSGKTAMATINSGCLSPVRAKLRPTKKFTAVTLKWKTCDTATGQLSKVTLKGKIGADTCEFLSARLKAKGEIKIDRIFNAKRSQCGDGIHDPGND